MLTAIDVTHEAIPAIEHREFVRLGAAVNWAVVADHMSPGDTAVITDGVELYVLTRKV